MEEWIGEHWHRFVTRQAQPLSPHAVPLAEVRRAVTLLLHAGGARQRVAAARPLPVGGERGFWQRLAGSGLRQPLAQLDDEVLALPDPIAVFDDAALNRALALWWAALASGLDTRLPWVVANTAATAAALQRFPGLREPWQALRAAEARELPADAAARVAELAPVWSWIVPMPAAVPLSSEGAPGSAGTGSRIEGRRRAQRREAAPKRAPLLLAPKGESLQTFADALRLDRGSDDSDDGSAATAADEIDVLSLERGSAGASRVRFDLDLPSAAADDRPVGPGERLPEWNPRTQRLDADRVLARPYAARAPQPWQPTPALRAAAARVRRQLERQRAAPRWQGGVSDGEEIDLDAWVRGRAEPDGDDAVHRRRVRAQRELATLLLADLSLSTDAHVNNQQRVIEVIRDALFVFGSALAAGGDAFAIWGFSSLRRTLRLHELQGFGQRWGDASLARVGAIKPGYYTRLGAALRAGTRRLAGRPERQRLLLVLTDGKPHDLDGYDGRLGLEDTRQAVLEARRAGVLPFAIAIDAEAGEVLPALFGRKGHAWVRRPETLPERLTGLYASLTR